MPQLSFPIIGYMQSPYQEKFGIPRQPNLVEVESYIEMLPPYNDFLAFDGIQEFSHLWLLWQFHDNKNQLDSTKFRPQVRPPRLGGNQKIGVFATRSMYRPSPIGLSVVKFQDLKKVGDALRLYVTGSDLLNATPILDIKPYIGYSDAIEDAQSGYAQQQPLRKRVMWSSHAEQQSRNLVDIAVTSEAQLNELEQVLSLDPRPAYQQDAERIYKMKFADLNVHFTVAIEQVMIVDLQQC